MYAFVAGSVRWTEDDAVVIVSGVPAILSNCVTARMTPLFEARPSPAIARFISEGVASTTSMSSSAAIISASPRAAATATAD